MVRRVPMMIGPLVGGWLISRFGWEQGIRYALLICIALSTITAVFQWFMAEETEELTPKFPAENSTVTEIADGAVFPTLEAERLAADFISRSGSLPTKRGLHPGPQPDLWTCSLPETQLAALYRTETIHHTLRPILNELALSGTCIIIHPPQELVVRAGPLPIQSAGSLMKGWYLTLEFPGTDPFAEAYRRGQQIYVGTGILAISLIALFALAVARLLQARLRLVRLQKDLVSNVAHELRTPVASIRALTDTLRAGRYRRPDQLERYLELLTRESSRLGEVIDHFLTFSRMEHGEQRLQFEHVSLAEAVTTSVTRARHRFATADADLQVELAPGLSGYDVCRRLRRKRADLPILMLTAKGQEADIVLGLNTGADDYVTKPFSLEVLLARVKAHLRRSLAEPVAILEFGDCRLDLGSCRLTRDGRGVPLTPKEFGILKYLVLNSGRAFTRDHLLDRVWGQDLIVTPRSVDRCITTLRNKIEADPHHPRFIRTIRDIGYRFESAEPAPPGG